MTTITVKLAWCCPRCKIIIDKWECPQCGKAGFRIDFILKPYLDKQWDWVEQMADEPVGEV